jgi:hypothetical protein
VIPESVERKRRRATANPVCQNRGRVRTLRYVAINIAGSCRGKPAPSSLNPVRGDDVVIDGIGAGIRVSRQRGSGKQLPDA